MKSTLAFCNPPPFQLHLQPPAANQILHFPIAIFNLVTSPYFDIFHQLSTPLPPTHFLLPTSHTLPNLIDATLSLLTPLSPPTPPSLSNSSIHLRSIILFASFLFLFYLPHLPLKRTYSLYPAPSLLIHPFN
ncbi:hypothetical protein BGS_0693 [Beggiatoa sp. SS]|nr:hypothetical protein BGS_0693 [Beggiatoa sp. SS]